MREVRRYDTSRVIDFLMVDANDHITGKTGLTPNVKISKNGAAFADPAGSVVEIGYGWYGLWPDVGDVDTLGPLLLHAEATGADPVDARFVVVAYDPYNGDTAGLGRLDKLQFTGDNKVVADVPPPKNIVSETTVVKLGG